MPHFLQHLSDILFPRYCAGCGCWDTDVCSQCYLLADSEPVLKAIDDSSGVPTIPIWALGAYRKELRNLILTAKHAATHRLDSFLWLAGTRLGAAISDDVHNHPVWVVPAPSSWKRRWQRRHVTPIVARGVVAGLSEMGIDAWLADIVRLRFGAGAQSSCSGELRRRGRRGAMKTTAIVPKGTLVVLVDDVMTTGATLAEMSHVMDPHVVSGAVLAYA